MPHYDETTVNQTIPRSSSRPHRVDQSRERYPRDGSLEEVYVERRQYQRDNQHPKVHFAIRHEDFIQRPHSQTQPPPRRQDSRRRGVHFEADNITSDSDSDYKRSRALTKRNTSHNLNIVPCSDKCANNPQKSRSQSDHRGRRHSHSRSRSRDSGYSSASDDDDAQRRQRNRKLLYTGLACVTTVAAANNIYQNTKAHEARKKEVREGEMCTSEMKRLKNKALMMDLFTVGVAAVGINNARMGWKRVEAIKKGGR